MRNGVDERKYYVMQESGGQSCRNTVKETEWNIQTARKRENWRRYPRMSAEERIRSSRNSMIVVIYLTIRRTGNGGHESGSVRQTRRRFIEVSQYDLLEEWDVKYECETLKEGV